MAVRATVPLSLALLFTAGALAQTTQGVIAGRVTNLSDGAPIAGSRILYRNLTTNDSGVKNATASGFYIVSGLPPGRYWLRVEASVPAGNRAVAGALPLAAPRGEEGFQAQEIYDLEVPVASWLHLDFALRPLQNVWEKNISNAMLLPRGSRLVNFFGPDVASGRRISLRPLGLQLGTSLATLSYVVSPEQVQELPLSQRDIYAMLVTLPGVTADNATARGLGLSINGQRPSSSSFLLDGVENNDYLATGPSSVVPPEAVQEYRVSINNFSAEFGRTAGYVANAVTRSGGADFHGLVYTYLGNEKLDANSFQRNARGLDRGPRKEIHAGFWAGGPVLPNELFFSVAFQRFSSRGRDDPRTIQVPILSRFQACPQTATSYATALLEQFQPPVADAAELPSAQTCASLAGPYRIAAPVELNRTFLLARGDYHLPARETQRISVRLMRNAFSEPFFEPSPYAGFSSPLHDDSTAIAATYSGVSGPHLLTTSFGWRRTDMGWERPHPELPALFSGDGVALPGSTLFYEFQNQDQSWEWNASLQTSRGRHIQTLGGGLLWRGPRSDLTYGRDGIYQFDSALAFGMDRPSSFLASVSREGLESGRQSQPSFHRNYSFRDYFGFWQSNVRLGARLGISLGARYEFFAPRKTTGLPDAVVRLGSGSTPEEMLQTAQLDFTATGRQLAYAPDRNNWAGRFGISYAPWAGYQGLVLRAAYGIFFDRIFDNLILSTRNNSFDLFEFEDRDGLMFPQSTAEVLSSVPGKSLRDTPLFQVDETLRTPYTQSWFAGLQGQLGRDTSFEVSHFGAVARKLIATDYLNRIRSHPCVETRTCTNSEARLQPNWGDLVYRSNAGTSSYAALGGILRHRTRRGLLQIAYTYGHSIDNQSEPLLGDFLDLSFAGTASAQQRDNFATFTRAYDSRVDRGSSDFDQRHNLVAFSIWQLPSFRREHWLKHVTDDWQVSFLAGFRSGFPFTVFAGPEFSSLLRNRPDLAGGVDPIFADAPPVPGGVQFVRREAFAFPEPGVVGTLGRNSLAGPGFWNIDFSVRKAIPLLKLSESARAELRADFFNLLNHANLGNPNTRLESASFGQALFGRRGLESTFPARTPLNESPRTIQLQLKLRF